MWKVQTTDLFDQWFKGRDDSDRVNIIAAMLVLEQKGPYLLRPYADTVKGSVHANMKELRIQSKGRPIRVFFAFDPRRTAVLLCAGMKAGKEKRFYQTMIPLADKAFSLHLEQLKKGG
ncbi:Toxin-antitoxin system, toxin component, RelE family [Alloalcanivorax dieselolei B5]|uniref:Toxin-antitoxin system, toxin component, RelE family n=1 Tax=Alcanivorax dieselolei (strain DSM 16502 / CGMCC 1.3690 / MCCC 1A00001 / B-5) TaxID=930169 RepID=K0CBC7_ALCDB|nr:type II toxin-antitoxin system RelE/ParE family toxin [Alloalcanivorax dieselolei]AFT70854.1 Toxin-antitoxin system, toxin component, RelE family [Alloalcanivorax dieselolei B5]GGJ98296.1 toxin RelE [Alloalcanivorax dieselolei]